MSAEKRNIDKMLMEMFPGDPEIAECFIGILNVISGPVPPNGPKLIQGYTAEQWQKIIDGGYLCEARDTDSRGWVPVILSRMDNDDSEFPFKIKYSAPNTVLDDEDHDWQRYCRPAQIKGVMRPIFVEPVDKEAYCHFFSGSGSLLFSGKWEESGSLSQVTEQVKMLNGATKYIEL